MFNISITDCACAVISLVHFYCEKHTGNIRFFKHRKTTISSTFFISKGFKGNVVNEALSSLHEVLFEIVPQSTPCIINLK